MSDFDKTIANFTSKYYEKRGYLPSVSKSPDTEGEPPRDRSMPTDIPLKDYVDARTDAVRAQNDARFAEVISKIDGLAAKIDHINTNAITWQGVWGAAAASTAAVAAIVLAVLTISGDRFDGGMTARGVIDSVLRTQSARDDDQDARLDSILLKMDALIASQSAPAAAPATQSSPATESPTEE